MLLVLRVLQIQANWLWTWLDGEEEESEEEEEEEEVADDGDEEEEEETEEEDHDEPLTPHGKNQAGGTVKKEHSEDEPDDTVVPEKHSSSSAKAVLPSMLEVKQEPQRMAEKKKRKAEERSPPKMPPKKSEAEMPKKKKDKDKPGRGKVSFAIGGKGPQKSIRAPPTRVDKFQHEGGYDRDLVTMQRILEKDFNATMGRFVMDYKECLSEEPKSRQEIWLALLRHTSVRALSVQSVLRCGIKNAQSAAAAREYFERRYPSSSPRQVAEGILKCLSACTSCAAAPQWPLDLSPPAEGLSLAELKMEGLRGGCGGGVSDRVSATGIEDIVDMQTDVLQVLRASSVVFLRSRSARHARSLRSACLLLLCLWRTIPILRLLQEKFVRFVRMAGLMAYELEEERQIELPASGAWSLVRIRELAAKKPRVSAMGIVTKWAIRLQTSDFYGPSPLTPPHPNTLSTPPPVSDFAPPPCPPQYQTCPLSPHP